jgi:hypothetical protein
MEPWSHEIVRTVSIWAAIVSVVLGFCLPLSSAAIGCLVAGGCLVAYASSVGALWQWPGSTVAIVVRLLFSVSGVALGAGVLRRALLFLAAPQGECGLPVMAAIAHCIMFVTFVGVELASWLGWWQLRHPTP